MTETNETYKDSPLVKKFLYEIRASAEKDYWLSNGRVKGIPLKLKLKDFKDLGAIQEGYKNWKELEERMAQSIYERSFNGLFSGN